MSTETPEKGFKVVDRRASAGGDEVPAAKPAPSRATQEVDFGTFVISLGSSVLVHLGELSVPGEAESRRDLPLAKQTIDILGMLAEKTRGNLTSDEAQLLEHLLYDLRLKYVEAKKQG
ncbi:MAG: DUF1844 domain-containing protein [Myxococcales bacterium]|nr:DUF1844 domain-containing protein [Myxococcales bacterium]